jgi:hypothetical protein
MYRGDWRETAAGIPVTIALGFPDSGVNYAPLPTVRITDLDWCVGWLWLQSGKAVDDIRGLVQAATREQ